MDPSILWAREEMERRLHEPCVIEHLAATLDLSLARFTRLFTDVEGVAPAQYLHQLRLARAKVLLERTFLSIGHVMALIGLRDEKQFEEDFYRAYGVQPYAVRDNVWSNSSREQ